MALDTAAKRRASLGGIGLGFIKAMPLPASGVSTDDRKLMAFSYISFDAPALLSLATAAGVATAALGLRSPHLFTMAADGVATATLSPLSSPTFLSLGQVDGVAAATAELVAGALFHITAAGSATAAATVIAPALLVISADGVASLTAILSSPAQLTLSQVDGVATATAEVTIFFRKRVKINGATVTVLRGHSGTVTVTKNKAGVVVRSVKIGGGVVS